MSLNNNSYEHPNTYYNMFNSGVRNLKQVHPTPKNRINHLDSKPFSLKNALNIYSLTYIMYNRHLNSTEHNKINE